MTSAERFPTYEAEERRRGALPPGIEAVPLHGTGAPALPDHVVDAVAAVLARRMTTPPVNGLGSLRRALATELERTTTRSVDPESQILVTNGAMQALGVCFRSLLEPGDEVVVPAPTFFFGGPIRTAGGVPVYVRGTEADGWRWDAEAIEQAIGAADEGAAALQPGQPDRLRALAGGRGRRRLRRRAARARRSSPTRPTRRRSGTARRSPRPSGSVTT